jgi:hypothetical protein
MSVPELPHDDAKAESFMERQKQRFHRIANALRATWQFPVITAIVLTVLIVATFMILRLVVPSATTTFISRFQFTFPYVETGRYPNAVRFTINEILDPAILDQVYNELGLNRFGLSHEAFYSAFSIRPFSPTEQELSELFRQKLTDRRLTFAERERLEQQLRSQLEAASRGAAELSFTLPAPLVLPPEVGRAVAQRVPRTWAQTAIEKKGVLRIAGFTAVDKAIPAETIDRQPLPLAILALIEASQRLDDRLFEIRKTPGISTVRDGISGKSFRDLEWDVRDLQLFHINPLRAALMTYAFPKNDRELRDVLQQRISYLENLEANATRQAQAIEEGLARFVDATAGLNRGVSERRTEQGSGGGTTTIPQVSESFIDRIIDLSRASLIAFQYQTVITERTNDQLELNRLASEYRGEQNRWKELLTALPSEASAPKALDEAAIARLAQQLRFAIEETNAKWATLSRMEAEFAATRLSRTAEIYAPLLSGRDVIRFDPTFNLSALAAVLSMLVIFCLGLWGVLAALFLRRKSVVG